MGDGEEINKGLISLSIEIADELSLGYQQQDKVADILMERVKPLYQRIESLSKGLGDALELLGRCSEEDVDHSEIAPLWALLEQSNENP